MADGVYNRHKYNMPAKVVDMVNDTIKMILLNNTHSFNPDHNVYADVSANEINPGSGNGYTVGGHTLSGKTLTQDDTNNRAVFDANDVSLTTATFTAYHLVLMDTSVGSSPLILSIDFGGAKVVTGGTFTVAWASAGIMRLT